MLAGRGLIALVFMIAFHAACVAQDAGALRPQCIAVLRDALGSDEFWPSMHAAEALTLAGEGETVRKALGPLLGKETDDQRRCGLARELVRAGEAQRARVMLQILANKESKGRIHAAESLFKVGQTGDGTALRAALDEGDPVLELMAAAALIRAGDRSLLVRVRRHLRGNDPRPRQIAAWVLGQLGDESDRAALREARTKEADPFKKSFLVNALARLGSAEALAQVERNLSDKNPTIRRYAALTLGARGAKDALAQLTPLLNDPDLDTRIRAAQAILMLARTSKP